jgi:fimbrial isopeptide formation D2 family protein
MKTTKSIARLAVTAGLTAALSFGGVMTPVTMAFAEDAAATANGSVTITNVEGNHTEFDGYQIFKADVATDGNKTVVSNITWANDDVKVAVEKVIKDKDTNYAGKTAQDAADWITSKVTGTDETTRVDSNHIAYKIAAAVDDLTDKTTTTKRVASGLKHGYWLFVTNADTIDAGEAGTSPIFTVVGSAPVKTTEKTGIPTVEKKVLDDSKVTGCAITGEEEANWKDAADSQIGQEVNYKLTGTIADNYASYDSYSYKFKDTLENGLDFVDGSLSVYALNGDAYTEIAPASYGVTKPSDSSRDLVVDFSKGEKGLKSATAKNGGTLTINADTKIVVFYKAKLNAKAVIAGANNKLEGNPNTVTLEYSNNPMVAGTGTSVPDTVVDYTYGLQINKVDLGTEAPLANAEFTITTKGDEKNAKEKYVAEGGKLSDTEFVHTTGDDGSIRLTGLDAGTYTVTEKNAPNGYTAVSSFEFTIDPTINDEGHQGYKLTKLEGRLDSKGQNDKVIAGLTDEKSGDNKLTKKDKSEKNADGTFNITVGDTKQINLPLTGLNGVTFTWIAGGAVLCIGVAHLVRSRKRDDGSEE